MNSSIHAYAAQTSGGVSSNDAMGGPSAAAEQVAMGSLAPTVRDPLSGPKGTRNTLDIDLFYSKPALSAVRTANFDSKVEVLFFPLGEPRDLRHKLTMISVEMAEVGNEVINLISLIYESSRNQLAQQAEAVRQATKAVIDQATEAARAGILGKIFGWIGKIFSIIFLTLANIALSATSPVLAALTIAALVLTIMDFCSSVCQEAGGPDISLAGLIALCAEAGGVDKSTADAIRQWLGLSLQVATIIIGIAGGVSAATKMAEMLGKAIDAGLKITAGLSAIGAGASAIYIGVEEYKLALAEAEEMSANQHHAQLSAVAKQWGEDLLDFIRWVDGWLQQRQELARQESESNQRLSHS